MAKMPRVYDGTQWQPLAVTLPDLSNYSTTTQMNTAIGDASTGTRLVSGTFTGASALNLSSYFSDTYKFYKLLITTYGSGSVDIFTRFRESTTDKATGYSVNSGRLDNSGASSNWASSASTTQINLGNVTSTEYSTVNLDIYRLSATSGIITFFDTAPGGNYFVYGSAKNSSMTNFNGVSVYPSSGTFTGSYILTGIK